MFAVPEDQWICGGLVDTHTHTHTHLAVQSAGVYSDALSAAARSTSISSSVKMKILWFVLMFGLRVRACPKLCQCFSPTTVVCSDDAIRALPLNISAGVQELILVACGVSHLDGGSFKESPQLTKLVVLNNPLKTVSVDAFWPLVRLQELEVSGNYYWLSLEAQSFSTLSNLTRLLLNNNKISLLDEAMFGSLPKLDTLQLRGNMLPSLPHLLLRNLPRLQELDLSLNRLSSISEEMLENNTLLQRLYLQGNTIAHIPEGIFTHQRGLQELNLRGNLLSDLRPGVFPHSLRILVLGRNPLLKLSPGVFQHLKRLTHLDLSMSQLSELSPDLLQNLVSLEHLDLSGNQISQLPPVLFQGLAGVHTVHLQNNNLSSLEEKVFQHLPNLAHLTLSWNHLQSLPHGLFDGLDFQAKVQLHQNPWRCDCGIRHLHDWLRHNQRNVEDPSRVYCHAPDFLRGHALVSVDQEQLVCAKTSRSKPLVEDLAAAGSDDEEIRCSVQKLHRTTSIHCRLSTCSGLRFQAVLPPETEGGPDQVVMSEWLEPSLCRNRTSGL